MNVRLVFALIKITKKRLNNERQKSIALQAFYYISFLCRIMKNKTSTKQRIRNTFSNAWYTAQQRSVFPLMLNKKAFFSLFQKTKTNNYNAAHKKIRIIYLNEQKTLKSKAYCHHFFMTFFNCYETGYLLGNKSKSNPISTFFFVFSGTKQRQIGK